MFLMRLWLKRAFKRAASQILQGRYVDRNRPDQGRFGRRQVDQILAQTWRNLDEMLPGANLDQYETLGNRQNVLLAVATRAAYHAFLAAGIDGDYATELISDVAWKVYASWIPLPRFFARLLDRDPQQQMNFILRVLLRYPFSPPGYQRKVWEEPGGFCTYWYRCPPHDYFKAHGTAGEMAFFNKTWCQFDWAVAGEMAQGGRYERPHTLSDGDNVCDMTWRAQTRAAAPTGQ